MFFVLCLVTFAGFLPGESWEGSRRMYNKNFQPGSLQEVPVMQKVDILCLLIYVLRMLIETLCA